jgi:hypothetical protein
MIVMLTVYCWLLYLYPGSYRDEFGEEMTSVFDEARSALRPALAAKISFCRREFCGLLSGALGAHFDRRFGPAIPFPRFDMQPQFRFPRSTVFLMLVIFAGVVLTIAKASSVAGDTLGSAWRQLLLVLVFMLLTMCTAAAVVWRILHALRQSGVHRLENAKSRMHPVESNGSR